MSKCISGCKRGERCGAYKRQQAKHARFMLDIRTDLDDAEQALRIVEGARKHLLAELERALTMAEDLAHHIVRVIDDVEEG